MKKEAEKKSGISVSGNGLEKAPDKRLEVLKTYKIYIGGKFPRTESGRYYTPQSPDGRLLGNICLSSRKDFREAVVAARGAFPGWSSRAAFNRGQILYRIAEMLEGRKPQFLGEMMEQGISRPRAQKEITVSIDRLVYYAGWCDKYQQIFGAVNPVATNHFNFSVPEPTGVVAIIAPDGSSLAGLVSVTAPVIAGGNTAVVLASETMPLCAVTFAEVIHSSDMPAGVVNILTGKAPELLPEFASHMDVNSLVSCLEDAGENQKAGELTSVNLKRFIRHAGTDWLKPAAQSPYFILDTQEIKTTWHPVERTGGSGSGY